MAIARGPGVAGRVLRRSYPGRIMHVAKVSVSIPDALLMELKSVAPDNMSAFITTAVRNELDRRRLSAFVDELEDELGPVDETEVAKYSELLAASAAKSRPHKAES